MTVLVGESVFSDQSRPSLNLTTLDLVTRPIFGWMLMLPPLPPARRSASAILSAVRRCGYTTAEMFVFNVLYYPVGTVWYWRVLQSHYWLRLALFPVWVWIAELLGGGYLLFVWNRRAWDYRQSRFNMFDGLIRLDYLPVWIVLGVLHDFLFFAVYTKYL